MADCCNTANTSARRYDLAIIGAGSAGFSAAIAAAEQGARVALIGHGTIGGTCVNTGCVPSKTLIRAAESIHQAKTAGRFQGIAAEAGVTDWRAVLRHKDDLVRSLRRAKYTDLLAQHETITYLDGRARLTRNGLTVDGVPLDADKTIITTGASPAVPEILGMESVPYLTSTTALEAERLPPSLLVLGGGYIGCELGQMFARMDVSVTIVDIVPMLSASEPAIAQALVGYFREEGITIYENVETRLIRSVGCGVSLGISIEGSSEWIEAEQALVTTGRRPNTADLGLVDAGIELHPNGGVEVDDWMRTTKPGVYAAGDVTGREQLVYMAAYGAKIAAKNAINGDRLRYDSTGMPTVVFTDPQVASVGLTEAEARQAGHEVTTAVLPLDQVPRALAARDTRGLIKLVADARTNRLVGAHILAPEGADSIQTAALAIKHGLTVQDLAEMIVPYLTTVEGLRLAAQSFEQDVARRSCCA